ncbi:MAG: c-type cytochrome [Gammaproteobacteria bacterium]|nr:c-type cytochrome [Gammaproteobacteria bacterium]MDD2929666.1 c-type cytochrome [Sideroxydans sp.]
MKLKQIIVLSAALMLAGNAAANETLFKKGNCVACHKVDKKLVGPALKDIAAKYAGDATAQARLVAKVRSGGKGVWGGVAMPPAPKSVSDDDLNTLVSWILSMK